jgi:hypothetical protein
VRLPWNKSELLIVLVVVVLALFLAVEPDSVLYVAVVAGLMLSYVD